MKLLEFLVGLSFWMRVLFWMFILFIVLKLIEPSYEKAMAQQKTAMGRLFIAAEYNRFLWGMM